jgi:hypothetical protein
MIVTSGNLTIAVDLAPGRAGMWWFSFRIPNYAGMGKAETFRGKMGYPDRETARKHAVEAVHAELNRHYAALGQDPPGRSRAADG